VDGCCGMATRCVVHGLGVMHSRGCPSPWPFLPASSWEQCKKLRFFIVAPFAS
jgi:hypothetical protein